MSDHGVEDPTVVLTVSELERIVKQAKTDALTSAEQALNRECLGFQKGWGSNAEDVAKLDVLLKTLTWLRLRADKHAEVLPRSINLKDEYEKLSDGAKIRYKGRIFEHRIGFGDFVSGVGDDRIVARHHDEDVELVDNNLE